MSDDLALRRRFFAEELEAVCALETAALVDALTVVPRERFLPPGPWMVQGGYLTGPRPTRDADPRHVYHNVAIAIDPARRLFNGQPGTVGPWIDTLGLSAGRRVLHVGCATGYYTALIAHCVGPTGRVLAVEADEALARTAAANLEATPSVEVRHGTAGEPFAERFDAIVINAGVTHPLETWLDALAAGGRMVVPLTVSMPGMGTIGKGHVIALARDDDGGFSARTLMPVAIFSAVGVRDDAAELRLRDALKANPFPSLQRLRREAHEPAASCWLHAPSGCLSLA